MICSTIWTRVSRGCGRLASATLAALVLAASPATAGTLKVFAAASLTDALDDVLDACGAETDIKSIGVYAGSGTIARQIAQGAPASIFISANPQWMDWLDERGMLADAARTDLLGNRLVLVASEAVADAWNGGASQRPEILKTQRLALADPETVPAGIYAKQALTAEGWWQDGVFLPSANVREALSWVARGEAGLGIVYRTDALREPRVTVIHTFPEASHDRIVYPAAILADHDSQNARSLLACLKSEKASGVFERFGFAVLGG